MDSQTKLAPGIIVCGSMKYFNNQCKVLDCLIGELLYTLKNNRNFYGQIPATLMPVVDRNNYGG